MSKHSRLFAVIPAAGESRRMGRSKLLLPLGGQTVMARLLHTLHRAEITERFVVIRPGDERLRAEVVRLGAVPVQPASAPADMRRSVEHALTAVRSQYRPGPDDGWLLIPGDHPLLEPSVLDALTAEWKRCQTPILVPTFEGRRGHPTLFAWSLAEEVFSLPADVGLNGLLQRHPEDVHELAVEEPSVLWDLDTPADYQALLQKEQRAES